jgi:hypothetical protein
MKSVNVAGGILKRVYVCVSPSMKVLFNGALRAGEW